MLVDLARNDLARISKPGTRYVDNMLHIDKYQSVMHLVSDVHGTLQDDLDALHAYQACMNMGTLSGAPKIKAHELIYKYEGKKRGSYGGVIAILGNDGSFDSCIAIRSAFVKDKTAYVQAGCGVDSALLEIMKNAVPNMPVYANTGCKAENIADKLTYCDGAFVGTSFKVDGKFENGVDGARVKEFMDIVKSVRTR